MDVITPYLSNLRLNNNKEKAEIIEPSTIVSKQILYIQFNWFRGIRWASK